MRPRKLSSPYNAQQLENMVTHLLESALSVAPVAQLVKIAQSDVREQKSEVVSVGKDAWYSNYTACMKMPLCPRQSHSAL